MADDITPSQMSSAEYTIEVQLGIFLTLKFYYFAAHKHISILFYTYLIAPISKYLSTSPCSSLTKSFLLESNLYNFSSDYNLTFYYL